MSCLCLFVFCYIFLFHQLGLNPLIDVDETRYADMAREILQKSDWITMHLNFNIFYEKPPLYFWMLASSYMLFGKISEFTARFPIALTASFAVFYTYYFGKKTISRVFGLISALILLSCIQFLVLARVAIIDMILSTFIMSSIYSGFLTYFCKESNQKYYWWAAYFFSALAVLAKGLPGLILPFAVMGFVATITGNLKKMFKPENILPGFVIFFTISLPWHLAIFHKNGMAFVNDYIIKQHFSRFIDSKGIGRQAPLYFFLPVFAVGFFPWICSFLASTINGIKHLTKDNILSLYTKLKDIFAVNEEKRTEKLLVLMICYFALVMLFFSASSTKLATYILPLYPAAALLTGYYWYQFIENGKNNSGIKISTGIFSVILLLAGVAAIFIVPVLNNKGIVFLSAPLKTYTIALALITAIANFIFIRFNKKVLLFTSQLLFMVGILLISINYVIPMIYNGGENELVSYAKFAKQYNKKLITFDFGVRPSTLFYYEKQVDFIKTCDYQRLKRDLTVNSVIIIKTENLEDTAKNIKFKIVNKGKKYSLLSEIISD